MSSAATAEWIEALDLETRRPPAFFASLDEIDASAPVAQAHEMRRAWEELKLSGIACLNGKPVVYFKDVQDDLDAADTHGLQRLLWNHGIAPLLALVSPKDVRVYSALALPTGNPEDVGHAPRLVETFARIAEYLFNDPGGGSTSAVFDVG